MTEALRTVPAPSEPAHRPLAAAAWMTGAIVSFSTMAIAGREAAAELDTFEIMTYRSLVGIAIVLAAGAAAGTLRQVSTQRLGLHLARNVAHFTGQNLWFLALTMIPLAQVFAFEFTSPIWVILLAAPLLGERLTRTKLLSAGLGFAGILVVAQPGRTAIDAGSLAALGAAVCFALTAIATRRLTRNESITSILVWLTLMQAVMGLACAGIDGDMAVPSAAILPLVVLIGAAGLAAHFCLTTALSLAPASTVMPMDFARLPVIAVAGMLLYAEPIQPLVFAGAALILGGNWLNLRASRR